MSRTLFVVAILGLSLVACRGSNGGGGDDDPGVDAPPIVTDATIQEIQSDAMASGTQVSIKGVVVVAIDAFGDRTGDIFIGEPGGGEFSGVKLFGAQVHEIAALAPGDIVDITGAMKHEGCTASSPCGPVIFDDGASITEVMPASSGSMTVTKVGTGALPAPATVDAKAIAALPTKAERVAEWEKWEGVLIKVENARQLDPVDTFGSNPGDDSTEFRITGVARVQSALVELPSTSVFGTCYESITGVGDFFFNYIIAPRTADDLILGGTGCLPMSTSVVEIQSSTTTPEVVDLTGVYITARDDVAPNKGVWVADALAGAAHNGVYVYVGGTSSMPLNLNPDLVVGARIDVQGSVDEFDLGSGGNPPVGNTITQVVNPLIGETIVAPAGAPTPATTASVATLADITNGEPWEGVLVQIGPVKVTNTNAGAGKVELTDNDGATILADDDVFAINPQNNSTMTMGKCYATITGVMSVQIFDDLRTLNPRSLADMVEAQNPSDCD